MKSVVSSNIEKVGFDNSCNQLYIIFKGGGIYRYKGVSSQLHNALVKADSVGSFFSGAIRKGNFEYEKITEAELNNIVSKKSKPKKKKVKKTKIANHPKNAKKKKKIVKKKKKSAKYGGKGI